METTLICSKIYETLQSNRMKDVELLSFWEEVQI
jgi:hypothetical protein